MINLTPYSVIVVMGGSEVEIPRSGAIAYVDSYVSPTRYELVDLNGGPSIPYMLTSTHSVKIHLGDHPPLPKCIDAVIVTPTVGCCWKTSLVTNDDLPQGCSVLSPHNPVRLNETTVLTTRLDAWLLNDLEPKFSLNPMLFTENTDRPLR